MLPDGVLPEDDSRICLFSSDNIGDVPRDKPEIRGPPPEVTSSKNFRGFRFRFPRPKEFFFSFNSSREGGDKTDESISAGSLKEIRTRLKFVQS